MQSFYNFLATLCEGKVNDGHGPCNVTRHFQGCTAFAETPQGWKSLLREVLGKDSVTNLSHALLRGFNL